MNKAEQRHVLSRVVRSKIDNCGVVIEMYCQAGMGRGWNSVWRQSLEEMECLGSCLQVGVKGV